MPGHATSLSRLKEEIKNLPELVGKTEAQIPARQKQKFEWQVNKIVADCVEQIGGNVTDFAVGKLIKMRKELARAAEPSESSKAASRDLVNLLSLIEKNIDPKTESKLETRVASAINKCIVSIKKQVDKLKLESEDDLKKDWLALRSNTERLLRHLEILNPSSEKNFIAGLWWMSQRGGIKDLDDLFKVKAKPHFASAETANALSEAEKGIIKNNLEELLNFFKLSPTQLTRVIEATIERCRAVKSPFLQRAFNARRPTQVIKHLQEIKGMLEDLFEPSSSDQWLNTPLELFDGKSPRAALLEGQTFPILHLLKRFDEGPHY